jgi:hypothetical protein
VPHNLSDGLPQPSTRRTRDDTPPPLYVGDANEPATILADADRFYATWFSGSDDDEVAAIDAQFDPLPKPPYTGVPPYWLIGRRTSALIQMYDLIKPLDPVRAGRYLERLRRIAEVLVENRDNRRHLSIRVAAFFPPNGQPVDAFRGFVMAAWGAFTVNRDGKWNTDVSTSGLFTYAMAAFARRVADDPALQAQYGGDAIRFTTASLETYAAFAAEMHLSDTDPQAWYAVPQAYADLACTGNPPGCHGYRTSAGQPIAYNENLIMMAALAEVSLAGTSALYLDSSDSNWWTTHVTAYEMPLLIAKNFTFFDQHLTPLTIEGTPLWDKWYTQPETSVIEDTAHGGLTLGCLAVILDDKARLNALLAAAGRSEHVALSTPFFVRFANTFLLRIWHYHAEDAVPLRNIIDKQVDGTSNPSEANNDNIECAGWISLAPFAPWIWSSCRDATFNSSGYYLREDNHAALLRYRQFA